MPKYNPLIFSGLDFTGSGGPAGAAQWKSPVDTEADLPMVANTPGDVRAVKDNQKLFVWDSVNSVWVDITLTIAAFGVAPNSDGATLSEIPETVGSVDIYRRSLNLEPADENNPGSMSIDAQSFSGDKTFKNNVAVEGILDAQNDIESSLGTLNLGISTATVNLGSTGALVNIRGPAEIDYTPTDSGDWVVPPSLVMPALDELAQRTKDIEDGIIDHDQLVKEPTGFPNRTDSAISFSDGSRQFTIQPTGSSFDVYIKGTKYTKTTADVLTIPNLDGDHYIYYDGSGNLASTQSFTSAIIQDYAFISIVYWNTETSSHTYFAEERHGLVMDGATHSYLHRVFGARFISGLALQGFTVDGTNPNNPANAQFTADSGTIYDEDIVHQIPAQLQIPILYRQNQLWRKKAADAFPLIYAGTVAGYAGSRVPYNQYTGGAWTLTQVQDSKFVLVHFFGTNDIDNPTIGIQGISEYGSIEDARIGANAEISSLSGLPFTEFVPVGSVIFQTRDFYSNTARARVRSTDTGANYVDFRGSQLYTPAGTATSHGLLSGLSNDDHFQYLLADGTRPMAGALDMGTHKINNVVDGTASTDAATVGQLTTATTGTAYQFAGFDSSGALSEVPGWQFDDAGTLRVGAQNSIVIPAGVTDYTSIGISPTVTNPGLANLSGIQINTPINQSVTNYTAIQASGYGTSAPTNFVGFASQPGYSSSTTNITHFSADGSVNSSGSLTGYVFNASSDSTYNIGVNISPQGDATSIQGVLITPSGDATTTTGIAFSPSGDATTLQGIEVTPTGTYTDTSGLKIDFSGATVTNRPVGIEVTGGTLSSTLDFTTQSSLPALVDSGNILRPVFKVESGSPITGTDVLMSNLAGFMDIKDNYSPSALDLGISSVGFVSQVAVNSGKTADKISMLTAGLAVDATSAGGTITDAHLIRGFASNFGGTLNINTLYGLKVDSGISSLATNSFGISIEDASADNYLAKSLKIGGLSKTTTNSEIALEIGSASSIRVGVATTAQRTALSNLAGLVIYDSTLNKFFGNNGSGWIQLNLSIGDIDQVSFPALDNQASPANITAFLFSNSVTRGFEAVVTIERGSTYAEYTLKGIQKASSWVMSQDYIGDETGISFSITTSGQIQYTSTNTGSGATIKFRAVTV